MKHFPSILIIGLLLALSCEKPTILPDTLYEITFSDGSGVAIFREDGNYLKGTFYADNGNLYADAEPVDVKLGTWGVKMLFSEGEEKKFSFKPYNVPSYPSPELEEVRLYRDSIYSVNPVPEEVQYGKARGYWTSYPKECHKTFPEVYWARRGMVLDGMEDCALEMDIYKPEGAGAESRPLFLMIHGGAFYYEDKADSEYAAWCRYFASLGYVAVSINYRMGFAASKQEVQRAGYRAVQDAHAAIRYLLTRRKDLYIDPERIFLAGNSAGAMTALNLAFLREDTKPESTKGGRAFEWINKLFGTSFRDLGSIDAINPSDSACFTIRAVANMWGAVIDPSILESNKVAIVSFHSEYDPTVDFGYDYPFKDYIQENLFGFVREGSWLKRSLDWLSVPEKVNHAIFDKMYGSRYIHQKAVSLGYRSKLYKYSDFRHSLHIDDNCLPLHFFEISHRIADFFSQEMETTPIDLHIDKQDKRWIRIDGRNVRRCYWKVEGGVVRETTPGGIRLLLFRDAKKRSVTVHGDYQSKATFKETLNL